MYANDNPDYDDNEDDADEDADTEERGDISYATRLGGQCLAPHHFLVPHQFIKLDHMLHHFGPHPTNINLPACSNTKEDSSTFLKASFDQFLIKTNIELELSVV